MAKEEEGDKQGLRFAPGYLGESKIVFTGDKQKIFLLEGATGKALVGSISRQIRSRASEWRSLPDLPLASDALGADLFLACDEDGVEVTNLREVDSLSARRAALAMRLRDMEAFALDLPEVAWRNQRKAFFESVRLHLLGLPHLFDFTPYIPRLLGLAIACGDYTEARELIERLSAAVTRVQQDCSVSLAADDQGTVGAPEILAQWCNNLTRGLSEALISALYPRAGNDSEALGQVLDSLQALSMSMDELSLVFDARTAVVWGQRLFVRDLGRTPFRMHYFPVTTQPIMNPSAHRGGEMTPAFPGEWSGREVRVAGSRVAERSERG